MNAAMGMVTMSQQLTADREDGTLLRAKATPNGMLGYLVGKLVSVSGGLLVDLAIFLVPGAVHRPRPARSAARAPGSRWPGCWSLGLVATLPIGAVLGSVFTSARGQGLLTLPILGHDRDLRHLLPDHRAAGVAAVDRPGRSRSTGSASACARRCCRTARSPSRSASPGGTWRPSACSAPGPCVGLLARADRAAPDGAPRVRLERGRAPREGAAAGRMRRRCGPTM